MLVLKYETCLPALFIIKQQTQSNIGLFYENYPDNISKVLPMSEKLLQYKIQLYWGIFKKKTIIVEEYCQLSLMQTLINTSIWPGNERGTKINIYIFATTLVIFQNVT